MLKFHCHVCEETFRITFEKLYNKKGIACPNCDHAFPDAATAALRQLGDAYMDAIDALMKTGEHKACWSLTVEGTEEQLPPKVNEYAFLDPDYKHQRKTSYWRHRQTEEPSYRE